MPSTTQGPDSTMSHDIIRPSALFSSSSQQPERYRQQEGFVLPFPEPSDTPILPGSDGNHLIGDGHFEASGGGSGLGSGMGGHDAFNSSAPGGLPPPPPYEPSSHSNRHGSSAGTGGTAAMIPLQSGPFGHGQNAAPGLTSSHQSPPTSSTHAQSPPQSIPQPFPSYHPSHQSHSSPSTMASPANSSTPFAAAATLSHSHSSSRPSNLPNHQPGTMPGMGPSSPNTVADAKAKKKKRRKLYIIICAAVLFFTIALVVGIAVGVIKSRIGDKPPPRHGHDDEFEGDESGVRGRDAAGVKIRGRSTGKRDGVGMDETVVVVVREDNGVPPL
ncbi:hypothetical protein MKZ38_008048 [Zalerion maritima]|uniref:Uncharacterized protein n=1 Tax=Zalerion maritima TaxID=339359 RepID=A0AAD5RLE0_9PEZI|nr:hypothetical protein MKZ38_008048 [Zalerion maritima]